MRPSVMVCEHVLRNNVPEMLYIEGGDVMVATCLPCADAQDERHAKGIVEPLPGFRGVCAEHIGIDTAEMQDGFYRQEAGRWVKEVEAEGMVN
jgi:hypothetical protein